MSYTTGTTHYNLPQTVGSDKRDWTDTNEAFSDVDAALWEAHQGATQAALDIASINSEIQTITGKQADDEADIATISGKVSTLETTVGNHTTEIGDVRRDLQDNIESSREDTATSTHAYEIGDYFYYNDVLFKATAQIAIGATIVPNTNCTGVTVMSEMSAGGASPDASQVSYDNTTSGLTADDVQEAVDELAAEKIDTFSGSVADASQNTYTAVTADGIAYDATNQQLLLKVNGADTVIPFSRGGYTDRVVIMEDYEFATGFALGNAVKTSGATTNNQFTLVNGKYTANNPGNTNISFGNSLGNITVADYNRVSITYEVGGVEHTNQFDPTGSSSSELGVAITFNKLLFGMVDNSSSPGTILASNPTPVNVETSATSNTPIVLKEIVCYKVTI